MIAGTSTAVLAKMIGILVLCMTISGTSSSRQPPTLSPKSVPTPMSVQSNPVALPVNYEPVPMPLQGQQPAGPIHVNAVHVLGTTANATGNSTNTKVNDFVFGTRTKGDDLLLRTIVYKKTSFWKNNVTQLLTFPPIGSNMKVNVTQITAQDLGTNKTGGFVAVTRGGVGTGNVTLLFTSLKGKPINFRLEIYGNKK